MTALTHINSNSFSLHSPGFWLIWVDCGIAIYGNPYIAYIRNNHVILSHLAFSPHLLSFPGFPSKLSHPSCIPPCTWDYLSPSPSYDDHFIPALTWRSLVYARVIAAPPSRPHRHADFPSIFVIGAVPDRDILLSRKRLSLACCGLSNLERSPHLCR